MYLQDQRTTTSLVTGSYPPRGKGAGLKASRTTASKGTTRVLIDGLPVEVTRKRVRNINLRVRADGSVHVSAPQRVAPERIEAFVRSKRTWIEQVRERVCTQERKYEVRATQGATIMLWGRPLVCNIVVSDTLGRRHCAIVQEPDQLELLVRPAYAGFDEAAEQARTRALERWLKEQLGQRIEELLPSCQHVVGKSCSGIRIKAMTSRWGSCNVQTGMISISLRLVHHEPTCLEYVLFHELCHLHEPSHNARFHALMDSYYPAWREVRARLNGRQA